MRCTEAHPNQAVEQAAFAAAPQDVPGPPLPLWWFFGHAWCSESPTMGQTVFKVDAQSRVIRFPLHQHLSSTLMRHLC